MYTRLIDTGTHYVQVIAMTEPKSFDASVNVMLDAIESFWYKK